MSAFPTREALARAQPDLLPERGEVLHQAVKRVGAQDEEQSLLDSAHRGGSAHLLDQGDLTKELPGPESDLRLDGHGDDPAAWRWGEVHRLVLNHQIFSRLPW